MIAELIDDIAIWTEDNWRLLDVFCALRFSPLLLERDANTACKPEPMTICLNAILERGQQLGTYRQGHRPFTNRTFDRFGHSLRAISLDPFRSGEGRSQCFPRTLF